MKIAVAYLRQSSSRDRDATDGGSVSLAFQLDAVSKWCANNQASLVSFYDDIDESGASTTRKGLDAFLTDVKTRVPDLVVFWDLKRLVRNLRLFLDVFAVTESLGTQLVSVTEGSSHPAFVWKLLALMGEEERERIAVNITHGKRKAAERGRHTGYAPLGYTLDADSNLLIDPDTRWIVEWMFARAIQGHTPTAICREANRTGIPTSGVIRSQRDPANKLGAPHWSRQTVAGLLRRRTYAGMVEAGARSTNAAGKHLAVVVADAPHQPIIDRATWDAVQRSLDSFTKDSPRRGSWHWLAGRVRCAACGSKLYYVDAGRAGRAYRDQYFRCRSSYLRSFGRERDTICPAKPRIAAAALDQLVRDALSASLSAARTAEDAKRAATEERRADARTVSDDLMRERASLANQRANIITTIQFAQSQQQLLFDLTTLAQTDRGLADRMAEIDAALASLPEPPTDAEIMAAFARITAFGQTALIADAEAMAEAAVMIGLQVVVDTDARAVRLSYNDLFRWCLG